MNIAVCVIGRNENRYAVEFVEYYKSIGVDKIFIYDNNYDGEEYFEEVLDEFIQSSFVEVIDFRNRQICQLDSYQDCYDKHGSEFDWICFFDFDEYLYMEDGRDIKQFLSSPMYDKFDMIHVNWMLYDDNDLVYYEDKPLNERFTRPMQIKETLFENMHIKSIVRGKLKTQWNQTPHTPTNLLSCCNVLGNKVDSTSPYVKPYIHSVAWIKHFRTKTIEEFYTNKIKRGYPDGNKDIWQKQNWLVDFFKYNHMTPTKQEYIDSLKISDITILVGSYKSFKSKVYRSDTYKVIYGKHNNVECDKLSTYKCINQNDNLGDSFLSEIYMLHNLPQDLIKNSNYVGLCHYRKYFTFKDDIEKVKEYLDKGYVIAAQPCKQLPSLKNAYAFCHNVDDFEILERIIKEDYNEYYEVFKTSAESDFLIPCNMFVMPKEYFLKYIEITKNIINKYLEAIGGIDNVLKRIEENKDKYLKSFYPNNTIEYQYRIGGYLIERFTHVFLLKHFKKIAFCPIEITESKY